MNQYKIDFEKIAWETPQKGVKQKVFRANKQQIRLLRFEEGFIEENWCTKAHYGYVLDGTLKIDFNGTVKSYKKGDGLWVSAGEKHKHKAILESNKWVELILFEHSENH